MTTSFERTRWALVAVALALSGIVSAATLGIATVVPEGSEWMRVMRAGAAEIDQRTAGRVKLKIIGGGIMGNDKKVLGAIRIGRLHGGALTPSALVARYPDLNVYGMPLVFNSEEEAAYVRERVDPILQQGLRDAGFESFGFAAGGFAVLMSNTPIATFDDMKGLRVWVLEGDTVSYEAMRALELTPVTLPLTDVLTGLQTGLVDVVVIPPLPALVLQWHTKVKYMTEIPLSYTLGFLAIDKRAFDKLQPGDQEVVREVMTRIYEGFDHDNLVDNHGARDALVNAGIEPVDFNESEFEHIARILRDNNRTLSEQGVFSEEIYETVQKYVAEYRSANP